jgi:membrane-associated phospholipid phosphatase
MPMAMLAAGFALAGAAFFLVDIQCVDGGCRVGGVLRNVAKRVSYFGEGYETLVPAAIALLVCLVAPKVMPGRLSGERLRLWGWRAWFTLASVGGTGLAVSLAKNTIGRARPSAPTGGVIWEPHMLAFKAAFASFPSGHATTAGATAMLLALVWPRGWAAFHLAGIAIAGSRVILGVHYPSDVMAGYTIGAVGTLALAYVFAGWGRVFRPADRTLLPPLIRPA